MIWEAQSSVQQVDGRLHGLLHHVMLVWVMHEALELQRDLLRLVCWGLQAIGEGHFELASLAKSALNVPSLPTSAFDLQPHLAASSTSKTSAAGLAVECPG